MKVVQTALPGLLRIEPMVASDQRGSFVKTFQQHEFASRRLVTEFAEEYHSTSRRGVLRGLHFQTPPHHHVKVVYCTAGSVIDVVMDLRVGSPAFGRFETFTLDATGGHMLYIPPGMAHGFYVPGDDGATMAYKVTTGYSKDHDAGIRFDSVGIPWPDSNPILSDRDRSFPTFAEFESPFRYEGTTHAR